MDSLLCCLPCFAPKLHLDDDEDTPIIVNQDVIDASVLQNALINKKVADVEAVIGILGYRNSTQLRSISEKFLDKTGRSLSTVVGETLKDEVGKLSVAISVTPAEYEASWLFNALENENGNVELLNEILLLRTFSEIEDLKSAYNTLYSTSLVSEIEKKTTGPYQHLLVSILTNPKPLPSNLEDELLESDIKSLYDATEGKLGSNTKVFVDVFTKRSEEHLQKVVKQYPEKTKKGSQLLQVVREEFTGNFDKALFKIVSALADGEKYIADQFEIAIQGITGYTRNDEALIRLVVRNRTSEKLSWIRTSYQARHGKSLIDRISEATTGNYKKLLVALFSQ